MEWASAIRSTFESVVHTHIFPRSQIDIVVHVLQQDGGTCLDVCSSRRSSHRDQCVHAGADGCGHSYGRLRDGADMWSVWLDASTGPQPHGAIRPALRDAGGAAALGQCAADAPGYPYSH